MKSAYCSTPCSNTFLLICMINCLITYEQISVGGVGSVLPILSVVVGILLPTGGGKALILCGMLCHFLEVWCKDSHC